MFSEHEQEPLGLEYSATTGHWESMFATEVSLPEVVTHAKQWHAKPHSLCWEAAHLAMVHHGPALLWPGLGASRPRSTRKPRGHPGPDTSSLSQAFRVQPFSVVLQTETRTYEPSSHWFPRVTLSVPWPSCPLKHFSCQNGPASPWNAKSCKENCSHPNNKKKSDHPQNYNREPIGEVGITGQQSGWISGQTPPGAKGQSTNFPRAELRREKTAMAGHVDFSQEFPWVPPSVRAYHRREWPLGKRIPRQTACQDEQGDTSSNRNRVLKTTKLGQRDISKEHRSQAQRTP